ncbi:MAG: S41 family peptidase [Dehalococcoidales bacterium]|nr:S41 family peptidase [Dehalococcoidales bacterium]
MEQHERGKSGLRVVIVSFLILALLGTGFVSGAAAERAALIPGSVVGEPPGVASTVGVLWQAWDLVQEHYVDRTAVDPRRMTYGAVEGMLDSLGDVGHTRFLSPEALRAEQQSLSGQLEGIGAELGVRDGHPTIVAPIEGSPAQRAGLRTGDVIVRVDGKDVTGLTVEQIVSLIRGPAGTSVTVSVLHRGEMKVTDITIVRARITVPNVSWSLLPGTQVAHVLISQFSEHTKDNLVSALTDARSKGATAIILDLRNDPGGLRDEAIKVASQFLREGNVLLEQDAQGRRTAYAVKPGGIALDLPLVVMINEGTASAAEIVAGALQDQHRGLLVGTTTFGTGTVLSAYHLSDGSAILLGTEEWLTPGGRQIWHHGITPDVVVALPADAAPLTPGEESGLTPAQLQASKDAQLLRALKEVAGSASSR